MTIIGKVVKFIVMLILLGVPTIIFVFFVAIAFMSAGR